MYYSSIPKKNVIIQKSLRLGRIQYMNVAPIYYGLDMFDHGEYHLTSAPPATLNRMLTIGQLDISPVSSIAYGYNQHQWDMLPDLSISSLGKVMSVKLISKFPLKKLNNKHIILTNESETASALLKLLLKTKKIVAHYSTRPVVSPAWVTDSDAALIIGDIALKYPWKKLLPHVYDLGEIWHLMTGLPFVFGVWAVRKQYANDNPEIVRRLTQKLHQSKLLGLTNISSISRMAAHKLGLDIHTCNSYYQCLNYDLTDTHIRGLQAFFDGLGIDFNWQEKSYPLNISSKNDILNFL
jgi:chorismate dehydratase